MSKSARLPITLTPKPIDTFDEKNALEDAVVLSVRLCVVVLCGAVVIVVFCPSGAVVSIWTGVGLTICSTDEIVAALNLSVSSIVVDRFKEAAQPTPTAMPKISEVIEARDACFTL